MTTIDTPPPAGADKVKAMLNRQKEGAAPKPDVSAESSSAASNSDTKVETKAAETSPRAQESGDPAVQAVPFERFREVNERAKQLAAEKAELEAQLAAEKKQKSAARPRDLVERLRQGDVDETNFAPAVEALVDSKLREVEYRAQLGTLPTQTKDAILKVASEHGLSLEEATEVTRRRSPSLFPEAAGFDPAQHLSPPTGRVPPADGKKSFREQMAAATSQGDRERVAFERIRGSLKR